MTSSGLEGRRHYLRLGCCTLVRSPSGISVDHRSTIVTGEDATSFVPKQEQSPPLTTSEIRRDAQERPILFLRSGSVENGPVNSSNTNVISWNSLLHYRGRFCFSSKQITKDILLPKGSTYKESTLCLNDVDRHGR